MKRRAGRAILLWGVLLLLAARAAAADFDGDGKSDLFWRNLATGENYVYPLNGTAILGTEGYARTVADQNWRVAAIADFDGDGKADLMWRNFTSGENYVYLMNGKDVAGEAYLRTVADQSWQVAGAGDFDGDGRADILWRNFATGENYVYPMDGLAIKATEGYLRTVASQDWQVAGVGKFDADANADILWRNNVTGENYLYPMDGPTILAGEGYLRTVADQNWQVAGVGRFDADSRSDILWRNRLTGENYVYFMDGTAILAGEGYLRAVADLDWQVAGVGDYDGDGRSDILWRNSATGENYLYPMNGLAILPTEGYLRAVADQNWHVAGSPARHAIDAVRPSCDIGLASNSSNPADYAKAMDLCRTAAQNAPHAERGWGLLSAELLRVDGTGVPATPARAIRANFGTGNLPGFGSAMTVLSTGHASGTGQANPAFAAFQNGTAHGTQSAFPADWLAANGGVRPVRSGCPASSGTAAHDPVMLKLRIRVPSNARSFSVRTRFFSADYPEYVCSPYTDYFLVLLDSAHGGEPANPADKNLSFDANGIPVGITSGLLACVNGATGCAQGATAGFTNSCAGTSDLTGTGFDTPDAGVCNTPSGRVGAGTAWFDVRGNVVPGEIIELRFALWDTDDGSYDSLVLLDDFRWSRQSTEPGTIPAE